MRHSQLQLSLPGLCQISEAVEKLAVEGDRGQRGAVYTRREVADFILDLIGYTTDKPLASFRLLEPAFGEGDFLLPAVRRLLETAEESDDGVTFGILSSAIRGVELHRDAFERTREAVRSLLLKHGATPKDADRLLDAWLLQGDFLLSASDCRFTHVAGNPPYVRHENVPDILMKEYRKLYDTVFGRSDLYIPFIEKSLRLLEDQGKLGFICSDRWTKNRYGEKLRRFVRNGFSLTVYVDMVGTDAFSSEVSAYPAITLIERSRRPKTRVCSAPGVDRSVLQKLATEIKSPELSEQSPVREIPCASAADGAWLFESGAEVDLVRRLEREFPSLEQAGCRVGIGVATGADEVFIGDYEELDVEPCRKLPLVMTRDIADGKIAWRGKGVVNPFGEDGTLVDLDSFPKLGAYLRKRKSRIAARHVAKKNPASWYRTVDRIYPELARHEKLLIPDIKGYASIVYEDGKFYPHHNLYFVTSENWNLHALQTVLRSPVTRLFISLYCTKMRGGYLRFQAQYLRKIHIPRWDNVDSELRRELARLKADDDPLRLNRAVCDLYRLSADERRLIETGETNGA